MFLLGSAVFRDGLSGPSSAIRYTFSSTHTPTHKTSNLYSTKWTRKFSSKKRENHIKKVALKRSSIALRIDVHS